MRSSPRTSPTRARLGGTAAVLAGLCYGAAGYLDRPSISGYRCPRVRAKRGHPGFVLRGLLGLQARLPDATQMDFASSAGIVGFLLGGFGAVLGIAGALGLAGTATTFFWWGLFLAGLTLMGLVASLRAGLRLLGAVVSFSGALGWVSLLSDPAF